MPSKIDLQTKLFPGRNLEKEWKSRYGTHELPPLVELSNKRIDTAVLRQEYDKHKGRTYSTFEDEVIGYAFGMRYCEPEEYWPMVVHLPSDQSIELQKEIDEERGISWVEHQQNLTPRSRLRSVIKLNEDYDPMIDERNYTKLPKALENSYMSQIFSMFRANVVRARFVRLRARERLAEHVDYNPKYCLKVHIPVTSHGMSFLTFYHNELGELSYQMECGKMYLINSGIRHDALNAAFDERVHLVLSLDGQQDLFSYVGTQGFAYELPKKPQSWRY